MTSEIGKAPWGHRRRATVVTALLLAAAVLAVGVLMALARPAHADSTITVTTNVDEQNTNGNCSLREAIINANNNDQSGSTDCKAGSGADTIVFDPGVSGTIKLELDQLTVSDAAGLTIDGGNNAITISGEGKSRVLNVSQGGGLTLKNLTVANGSRTLDDGGGVVVNDHGTLTVINSTFSGNSARSGGGIFNASGTVTVTNSTFSGNSASDGTGGGILTVGGVTVTVTNSTFSGNSAFTEGGDIFNASGQFASTVKLGNTIVANSPKGNNCAGAITDDGYNISSDGSCNFSDPNSKNSTDPKLDSQGLQDNGGPTKTIALESGSPAIDQGNSFGVNTDQRGKPRPVDDPTIANAPGGDGSDVGAFEAAPNNPPPPPPPPSPSPPPPPPPGHHKHHHSGGGGGGHHKHHHKHHGGNDGGGGGGGVIQ